MSHKHTSPPWYFNKDQGEVRATNQAGLSVPIRLAVVYGTGVENQHIFNGRLLAAAPELLEALLHAVEKFEEMGMGENTDTLFYKRAIKKATE